MTVKSKEILEQIRPEDISLLQKKELVRKFGRPEDCVELHVYDLNNNLLDTIYNFEDYEIPNIDDSENYFNEITFNPDKVLRDLGYTSGDYDLRVNFHRRKIANTLENLFYINTISPSRTELRVKIKSNENLSSLINATNQFIAELGDSVEGASYFKDFALNLGDDIVLTGVNFIAEQGENNSFLIKLYEPLPNNFSEKTQFRIIEELTNPISYKVNLEQIGIQISSTELRGPNLKIDTRLNSSIPTAYRAYNDILKYTTTSSLNNVLNALSASVPISVEYDNPNTDSGYVYDKFTHFSSAEERLRNFKYKLELVELYESKSVYMQGLTPRIPAVQQQNEDLKNKILQNFDNWENYLYYESGAYAWPKGNSTKPYSNRPVTSSQAVSWFNTHIEYAKEYDEINPYILRNTLPQYIIDNDQNEHYITFVDMIGQYFDNIWLYIENITDKNIAHNALNEGISKDLVFNALKERGIPAFDQFENKNLFDYLLYPEFELTEVGFRDLTDEGGRFITDEQGRRLRVQNQLVTTLITGSNIQSPLGDVTKEVWKRLYHNAPYLLKTKGTERGVKALLACYGIPESILHVKEYGGPKADKSGFRTFKYPKMQKALEVEGIDIQSPAIIELLTNGDQTVEFTILPKPHPTRHNIILSDRDASAGRPRYVALSPPHPVHKEAGRLIYKDNAGNFSYSDYFPAYCGRPITFYLETPTEEQLRAKSKTISKLKISATMFVDNEYISVSLDPEFTAAVSNIPISVGNSNVLQGSGNLSNFLIHNFKIYKVILNNSTKEQHTKDPNILAANTTSSFFDKDLVYYAPLGANLEEEQPDYNANFTDYSYQDNTNSSVGVLTNKFIGNTFSYKEIVYDHYISTPDTVGASMASEKIRYDQGTVDDNILSPVIRSEESTLDRQPQDFSNLGIFFSPTFEINEDIIYTLGGFRLDDYIGDPTHLNSGSYPNLKNLRKEYAQKIDNRYNFWDYLRTIQFFDHTIFKIIEEFAPVKANLKTGLVIEPHYLERDKINYANTDFSQVSFPDFNIPDVNPSLDSEYILHETTLDVEDVLDGSGGEFRNNFTHGIFSRRRFRVAQNRQ